MISYLYLLIAIISELIGTSLLKASEGFSKLWPSIGVFLAFGSSFLFLSLTLKAMPLSVAYAIWSGLGTVATAVISVLVWKEKLNMGSAIGILLIVVGVVVLNMYGSPHDKEEVTPAAEQQASTH
ncbi:QacE family quaternary ammonium compound efflux SMR transporter [Priestia megaterium]|nr:QacE family quaternary ammonium compound efflux SMR transporter [Priestia megaterium]